MIKESGLRYFFHPFYRPLHKHILSLAIPGMIALVAEPLLGLVDTALVGHLGVLQLGGLAVVNSFLSMVIWLFNFFINGTNAITAYYTGKNLVRQRSEFYRRMIWIAAIVGMILGILGLWAEDLIFRLMGANEELHQIARSYYLIRLAGIPLVFINFISIGYFRGLKDMKTPMVIAVVVNGLNAVLDVVLIYGIPGWFGGLGLAGAAIATVSAQFIGAVIYLMLVYRKFGLSPIPSSSPSIRLFDYLELLRLNGHLFLRTFFLLISFTFATAMATRMGNSILGAHQIGIQIWLFLAFLLDSFAIAAQSIAGQLKGKGSFGLIKKYGLIMQWYGLWLGLVIGLIIFVAGHRIFLVFTSDPQVLQECHAIYSLVVLFQPLNGVLFLLDGLLIGVMDTRFLMIELFIAGILVYIPISLISFLFCWGITGIWTGLALFLIVRWAFNAYRFHSNGFVHISF